MFSIVNKYCVVFSLLLLPFLAHAQPTAATTQQQAQCAANGVNYDQATVFVNKLQAAVKQNDIAAVAKLISYPLRLNQFSHGKLSHKTILNEKSFMGAYDKTVTPRLKQLLLAANPTNIFCNDQGGMIANGAIWFKKVDVKAPIKVFSINLRN